MNDILSLRLSGVTHIVTEKSTKFLLMLQNSIDWTKRPEVTCVIKESKFDINRTINTYLKRNGASAVEGYIELTFPESLSGAAISLFVLVMLPEIVEGVSTLTAYSKTENFSIYGDNQVETVKKTFWTKEETACYDVCFPEVQDVYPDDYAFLHVHTQNMYGKHVWINSSSFGINKLFSLPVKTGTYQVRNNVLSVPYNMQDVLARYRTRDSRKEDITIETSAGKTTAPNLLLHQTGKSSNPVRPTLSPAVKVTIDNDDLEKLIRTQSHCSVEFRPQKSYHGEYGFSWIHTGDTVPNANNPFNDYAYKNIMGKQYKTVSGKIYVHDDVNEYNAPVKFDKDSSGEQIFFPVGNDHPREEIDDSFRKGAMFERMSRKYLQLLFRWKDAAGKPFRTFVPLITVMLNKNPRVDKQEINLDLFFDVKEIPEKIVLEFNNKKAETYLTLSKKEFTGIPKGKSNSINNAAHKLKITCSGEFNDEYILYARAFGKNDPKGNICGVLRFHPNSAAYQQTLNLVVFNVTTNIGNGPKDKKGKLEPPEIEKIYDILGQSLTFVHIEKIELNTIQNDMTIDPSQNSNYFRTKFCKKVGSLWVIDNDKIKRGYMKSYLLSKINPMYRD